MFDGEWFANAIAVISDKIKYNLSQLGRSGREIAAFLRTCCHVNVNEYGTAFKLKSREDRFGGGAGGSRTWCTYQEHHR
jgi:hypothetical protein